MEQIDFSVITSIIATMNNTKPHTILEQLRYQTKIINAWNVIVEKLDINQTELDEKIQEILISVASLTSRVDGIDTQINGILNDLSSILSRLSTAESGIASNVSAITALTTRIGLVESDISSLQARVSALETAIANKQDTLVSGTNIKTIGGVSILGGGNITLPETPSLYEHTIVLTEYGDKYGGYSRCTISIINNVSTPFNETTLSQLGGMYQASGLIGENTNYGVIFASYFLNGVIYGINFDSFGDLSVSVSDFLADEDGNHGTMVDNVRQII